MKSRLTIKKPSYIGTAAQILAAGEEAALRGRRITERAKAARARIGQSLLQKEVEIIRIGGSRYVLTEPGFLRENPIEGAQTEARAVVVWAGNDGSILVSTGAARTD
jgi:hypothetical protein